ncbi:MAG TPA: thiamine-binding protein [Candidatus Acidoferrales bacterium]|nr:thiamine-binding protein [Candidatus Acidoferrales bacterium]
MKNKPTASIAFQVMPKTTGDAIKIIDKVIAIVKKSGVKYEVGPMETTMEGDLDTLFDIVREAQDVAIKAGATQVFTNVKILYNPKGVMTIDEKVTKHR